MHDQLFPAATSLNNLNLGVLDAAYPTAGRRRTATSSGRRQPPSSWSALWLRRKPFYPPDAPVAQSLAGGSHRGRQGFPAWRVVTMRAGQNDLKVAKKDAFDSVVALDTGRSIAATNADESRYLIDPERAAQYQAAFLAKSLEITKLPTPVTIYTFDATLAPEIADAEKGRIDFGGYLGTELNNVTFPGERRAALATLQAWATYEKDDRRLRANWSDGQQAEAI